jgi:hypothetical protein
MNRALKVFLELTTRHELKWMYHYQVDDSAFGVATDKYQWCKMVLSGKRTIEEMLEYYERYYSRDEEAFIARLKDLM